MSFFRFPLRSLKTSKDTHTAHSADFTVDCTGERREPGKRDRTQTDWKARGVFGGLWPGRAGRDGAVWPDDRRLYRPGERRHRAGPGAKGY